MCVFNGLDYPHCLWHQRIIHLYDLATGLTDSGLFDPSEVLAALEDCERVGELPTQAGE